MLFFRHFKNLSVLPLFLFYGCSGGRQDSTQSQVTPSSGPELGGTLVTITGSGFTADSSVMFGSNKAASLESVTPNQLVVKTPKATPGSVDMTVIKSANERIILSNAFTFISSSAKENNKWGPISSEGFPKFSFLVGAIWTGEEMIVFGHEQNRITGARYKPTLNSWKAISSQNAPRLIEPSVVWTGEKAILWGGSFDSPGAIYDPRKDTWVTMSKEEAPDSLRTRQSAVWTGSKMIIWGGVGPIKRFYDGGVFDLASNSWSSITTKNAPVDRIHTSTIWTGKKMIVYGGLGEPRKVFNTGAEYDPESDTWSTLPTENAPPASDLPMAVWTGSKMIIWGGRDADLQPTVTTGGIYDPVARTWESITSEGAPNPRSDGNAFWTGSKMLILDGDITLKDGERLRNGMLYDPVSKKWESIEPVNTAEPGRSVAVLANDRLITVGRYPSSDASQKLKPAGIYMIGP